MGYAILLVIPIDQCLNDPFLTLMVVELKITLTENKYIGVMPVCFHSRSVTFSKILAFQKASL